MSKYSVNNSKYLNKIKGAKKDVSASRNQDSVITKQDKEDKSMRSPFFPSERN
jgi:hypothetical protein